jgi:hypothetical protein
MWPLVREHGLVGIGKCKPRKERIEHDSMDS